MKKDLPILKQVEILDVGAEGNAIAKVDEKVVFVPFVVPGDVVDIQVVRNRKNYMEGKAVFFHKYSQKRAIPFCKHFGLCGGCRWQYLSYEDQLLYKQRTVEDAIKRIAKVEVGKVLPIKASENSMYYRNKLEYTFSVYRWFVDADKVLTADERERNALGFHLPKMFDRILDIQECYLQKDPSNAIRLAIKKYALDNKLAFYDIKKHQGFLRNIIIRNSNTGDLMVIVVFAHNDEPAISDVLKHLTTSFPEITSLFYTINDKMNDALYGLEMQLYHGKPFIVEQMEGLHFKIGPMSFFQTNSLQAYQLYKVVRAFAGLKGDELVYDLYTGTGTIANFVSVQAKKVVGIDNIASAIEDAVENAKGNNIHNTHFVAGEVEKILNENFVKINGVPDVVITDPPRVGMHEKVINQLLAINPEKIVYVSCNPATQARDISLLSNDYRLEMIQPVDMFPHTLHIENVALLVRKG